MWVLQAIHCLYVRNTVLETDGRMDELTDVGGRAIWGSNLIDSSKKNWTVSFDKNTGTTYQFLIFLRENVKNFALISHFASAAGVPKLPIPGLCLGPHCGISVPRHPSSAPFRTFLDPLVWTPSIIKSSVRLHCLYSSLTRFQAYC